MSGRESEGSFLTQELLRLLPDVFKHPVWMNFVRTTHLVPESLVSNIRGQTQQYILEGDISSACQLYLLCAALKKIQKDYAAAQLYAQQAFSVAELNGLVQTTLCAAWGLCALSVLQGDHEAAAGYLHWLRDNLSARGDWVLADILDTIEPDLSGQVQKSSNLERGLDPLRSWGEPQAGMDAPAWRAIERPKRRPARGRKSVRSILQTLRADLSLILAGKARLQLVRSDEAVVKLQVSAPPAGSAQVVPSGSAVQPCNGLTALPTENTEPTPLPQNSAPQSAPGPYSLLAPFQPAPAAESEVALSVYCLGDFRVFSGDQAIEAWPGRKALSIFKYLVIHHQKPISKEILMDTFWPEAGPESSRNRLNVAIHALRQALRPFFEDPLIVFEADGYGINPVLHLWIDTEEFENHIRLANRFESAGQIMPAVGELEIAASLYQGDFLQEDLYEDWAVMTRERLRMAYLDLLDRLSHIYFGQGQYTACMSLCQKILEHDRCREDAHCRLMRCYSRLGQDHLALRQYQSCKDALRGELEVDPEPATAQLAERIRHHERV